jgi:regulator of replication initiation timing
MAKNYSLNNLWDHVDAEACTKAADEIASLKADAASAWDKCEERRIENETLKAQLAKYQASGTTLNARVVEIDVLKDQLAECKKEGLEMRKSLINWRSKAFVGTNQTLVIDREYPYFAAIAAQKEEA